MGIEGLVGGWRVFKWKQVAGKWPTRPHVPVRGEGRRREDRGLEAHRSLVDVDE